MLSQVTNDKQIVLKKIISDQNFERSIILLFKSEVDLIINSSIKHYDQLTLITSKRQPPSR